MTTATRKPSYQMTNDELLALPTEELIALDAKMGYFLDHANTPDGQVYVAKVREQRAAVRAELERRKTVSNVLAALVHADEMD